MNAHLSGKELFIRFTASAFRKLLSIYVFSYFPFGSEGRMCDLIVSVPDHCYLFTLDLRGFPVRPDMTSSSMVNQIWGSSDMADSLNPQAEVLKNKRAAHCYLRTSSMTPHASSGPPHASSMTPQ